MKSSMRKGNSRNRIRKISMDRSEYQEYIGDSLARQTGVAPKRIEYSRPPKKLSAQVRRNREKAGYMSISYATFLMVAIAVMSIMCARYLKLQSSITSTAHSITTLESQLNDLKLANEEEYARIMGAVDLEQIKHVAMEELGMGYPKETQMVTFTDNDSDYVRQYMDIPK